MAELKSSRFSCGECGRSYTWKPELAGRRAKCSCGQLITVPPSPMVQEEENVYDIAPAKEETPAPGQGKRLPLAPRRRAQTAPVPTAVPAAAPPILGYQSGPTKREVDRTSLTILLDLKRDIYAPVVLLIIGLGLYVGYYAIRYELSGTGVAAAAFGLGVMTAFKAVLLTGFAFIVAGKIGVSFGGIWTASLKLAAIAVFCDGVTTWVDAWVNKVGGMGGGIFGYGAMSFPVALAIYWLLLMYLFSMDSSESWSIVMLLSGFDLLVRTILSILLLQMILGWGGVAASALPMPSIGGGDSGVISTAVERFNDLKDANRLREAKAFIAAGNQAALTGPVNAWYAAGTKNIWFEVDRDFNGKITPTGVVIELPRDMVKDKPSRDKCFEILKSYYEAMQIPHTPKSITDTGDPYVFVTIR